MPIQTVVDIPGQFTWVDCHAPQADELKLLTTQFRLPPHMLEDCLRPEHLPKYEASGNVHFFIFRAFDENNRTDSVTVQQITRKIAVFYGDGFLVTIHRVDQPFFKALKEKWTKTTNGKQDIPKIRKVIFADVLNSIFTTFENPIEANFTELEQFESSIFNSRRPRRSALRRGYHLKRKSSVMKRMMKLSFDVTQRSANSIELDFGQLLEIKERLESLIYYADELEDQVTALLNLHLSMASQYTNEVVRVLTVFSIFFLPLNFIAGIYGMNFDHMPELKWPFGYVFALTLMSIVALSLYYWFKRKGWMGRGE